MIWQHCVKCRTYFSDRKRQNWCWSCWADRNPTPQTVNVSGFRIMHVAKPKVGQP